MEAFSYSYGASVGRCIFIKMVQCLSDGVGE